MSDTFNIISSYINIIILHFWVILLEQLEGCHVKWD